MILPETGKTLAQTVGYFVSAGGVDDDTGVAMEIWYDTKNGDATTRTLEVNTTTLVFIATGDTASLPDDDTSTAGTLTFSVATVDTFGEIADLINATTNWKCRLIGAIRAGSTQTAIIDEGAATEATAIAPVRCHFDHGNADRLGICIGAEYDQDIVNAFGRHAARDMRDAELKPGDNGRTYNPIERESAVDFIEAFGGNSGSSLVPVLNVYSSSQSADSLIYSVTMSNDTLRTLDEDELHALTSSPGRRIVVQLVGASPDVLGLSVRGRYGKSGRLAV